MRATIFAVILLFLANLVLLNYKVFFARERQEQTTESGFNIVDVASPSAQKIVDSCYPYSCVDLIREATASLTPKTTVISSPVSASKTAQEFYVSFGSGQTLSDEWEDVPGLSAYIDSTKYDKIKTVTFEVSMRIPTANGRVYAQLFNATDKHPVWFSEVSTEGNTPQLLISPPITLDEGNKLYKVQTKTTLRYLSILDQARVHIITE